MHKLAIALAIVCMYRSRSSEARQGRVRRRAVCRDRRDEEDAS